MSYACNAAQKGYIKQAIVADVRLDGRQNAQLRKSHISKGREPLNKESCARPKALHYLRKVLKISRYIRA